MCVLIVVFLFWLEMATLAYSWKHYREQVVAEANYVVGGVATC